MTEISESHELQELIDRLDPDERTSFAEVILGEEAEDFCNSEIGRFMIGCAKQDCEKAHLALENSDPEDAKTVRKLQNDIRVAKMFLGYLKELVVQGKLANHSLQTAEEN